MRKREFKKGVLDGDCLVWYHYKCARNHTNKEIKKAKRKGFAKSRPAAQRPAAQGTLHGPRPGGPLHSSHPAVQFQKL